MKIIKFVATCRCQILRLKCTKFNFGWGSAPDPAGALAAIGGILLLRGGEGEREGMAGEGEREMRGRRGGGGEGDGKGREGSPPLLADHFNH